jgi:hypothetical protein
VIVTWCMKRDVILFNELGSIDDMLGLGGDQGGATTTHLRQVLRCSWSRPQVRAATVGLTYNDCFH